VHPPRPPAGVRAWRRPAFAEIIGAYEGTLARSLGQDELRRALAAATTAFVREVGEANPELAKRLALALQEITAVAGHGPAA
jgi:hypothetical protein